MDLWTLTVAGGPSNRWSQMMVAAAYLTVEQTLGLRSHCACRASVGTETKMRRGRPVWLASASNPYKLIRQKLCLLDGSLLKITSSTYI